MRYTYLGDKLTAPVLRGMQCDPVRRADGKCVVSTKMATALVVDVQGKRYVVLRRRLRLNKEQIMHILWNDQCEYCFVCEACYADFRDMQFAGSSRSYGNWRGRAEEQLRQHEVAGKPCEFCGPNGNGGWMTDDGRWPAAERRDARKKQSKERKIDG